MPFPALVPLIGGALKLFGGIGQGKAEERNSQNDFLQRENQLKLGQYGTEQGARINLANLGESSTRDRADRAISAPQVRAKQALISQLLKNMQGRSVSGLPAGVSIPTTRGGTLQSLQRSPQARQALQLLTDNALNAMITGSDVPAVADTKSPLMAPPTMAGYKGPGKMESIMSGLGIGGSILDLINRSRSSRAPSVNYPIDPVGGG